MISKREEENVIFHHIKDYIIELLLSITILAL